ncbi:MAG TPA: TIGR02587 family membrane protein [Sphingomicrobium sp.]
MAEARHDHVATTNRHYAGALARAFAGALIFSLPLLLTMEMWWLGFYLEPWRLMQFMLGNVLLLYGLSHVAGFEESHNWADDILDAFSAYLVATVTAAAVLTLIGALRPQMTLGEAAGMVAIQSVPASFGAMIGAKLLGEGEEIEATERWRETYSGELFLMLAGALFLSFTVVPTEEMILIAFQIDPWHALATMAASLLLLHAILYLVGFEGQERRIGHGHGRALLFHSLPGYAIALLAAGYMLWTFGRLDGLDLGHAAMAIVVVAFPASIGAAIAQVVI